MFASTVPSVPLGSISGFLSIICIILYPAARPEAKAVTHGVASPSDIAPVMNAIQTLTTCPPSYPLSIINFAPYHAVRP
uniref:Uncharacterized protein n=1 Tax=Arundo donax TaxID=35708 RepID=A0A0A9G0H0_ARUDO